MNHRIFDNIKTQYLPIFLCSIGIFGYASTSIAQDIDLLSLPEAINILPELAPAQLDPPIVAAPESQSDFTGTIGINQSDLTLQLKSFGAPYPDGRIIPADIWQESTLADLDYVWQSLSPINNPKMMLFLRDIFLAEAALPKNTTDQAFLEQRAQSLAQIGLYNDAIRLLNSDDNLINHPMLDDYHLALFNFNAICPRQKSDQTNLKDDKLQILCLLLKQDSHQAAIQTQLLQETAPAIREDGFALLISLILLQQNNLPTGTVITPDPIHIALARLGNIAPVFAPDSPITQPMKRMLMEVPAFDLDRRIEYAESAYSSGHASIDDLTRLQFSRQFTTAERKGVMQLLRQFPSAISRALAVQMLAELEDKTALALAMLHHGDNHNNFTLMAYSLKEYLDQIDKKSDLLARAYLALGQIDKAKAALPSDSENLLLSEILHPVKKTDQFQQTQLLDGLILEEDLNMTEPDPWQIWFDGLTNRVVDRGMILALLPSFDVQAPMGKADLDKQDFAATGAQIVQAITDIQSNDPEKVQKSLRDLHLMGYTEIAQGYAAQNLAELLY